MKKTIYLTFILSIILAGCDSVDPEARRQAMHLPPPGFKADAAKGEASFQQYCASCHGSRGQGSEQGPPLVHQVYRPAHHANLSFHWAIRDGVKQHHWEFGDMAPLPNVTPEDVGDIIAYIRKRQRKAGVR